LGLLSRLILDMFCSIPKFALKKSALKNGPTEKLSAGPITSNPSL